LFFSDNAANAEVKGLEADMIWLPSGIDGLTVSAGVSVLDTEMTKVITPTKDVSLGDELAFAPRVQGNLQARYEWDMSSGMVAHVMPHLAYSAKSYSDVISINREEIASWTLLGITAGVSSSTWGAEIFVDNIADSRAEMARNFVFDRSRVSYARPRTMGVRLNYNF
jgi:iron complex outermembrane receptor protein